MYTLNTKSGYLHDEDHESSGEPFARADAADLRARALGMKMQFCKTCFGDNRNTLEMQRLEEKQARLEAGDIEPVDTLSATQRVQPTTPQSSVHAADGAVPAGRVDLPTPPQTRPRNQTDR